MTAVIDAKTVKELREKTGAGMMDCKEALSRTGGDFEKAIDYLRKKGMASADKKASRAARQGLVGAFVKGGKSAGMIEVNCETDFVARTDVFKAYVQSAARAVAEGKAVDPESVKAVTAKVGENVQLGRSVAFPGGAKLLTGSYLHMGGKIGVLVEIEVSGDMKGREALLAAFCEDLAMQVAAARPLNVRRAEVAAGVVEHEKEIYRGQAAESKKPPAVAEKIVEGKLEKFYQQVCLEEQDYIKDPAGKLKVRDHVKSVGADIRIVRFARFEVGEGKEAGPSC